MRALLSFHSDFSAEVEKETEKWLTCSERSELFYFVESNFIEFLDFGDISFLCF